VRKVRYKRRMKTIIKSVIAIGTVCLLAGCESTGMSLRERPGVSYPNYILSIATNSTGTAPAVTTPLRIAAVQVGEVAPQEAILNQLAGQKSLVASVVPLPLPAENPRSSYGYQPVKDLKPEDYADRLASVRSLAGTVGADYVFLFGGNIDASQKHNPFMIFDVTLIGAVLVPGTRVDVEGKGSGVLIHAPTGTPVLFVSSESRRSKLSPDQLADDAEGELRRQVRDDLVQKLGDDLLKKLAEPRFTAAGSNVR